MTDLSMRLQILERQRELIAVEIEAEADRPEAVQILDYDPAGELTSEAIFAVDVTGEPDEDRLSGGIDQQTSDEFSVTWIGIARMKSMTPAMARGRVDEFYRAIRRVAYAAKYEGSLGDFTATNGTKPVCFTSLGTVDGPVSDPAGPDGHWGFVRVDFRTVTQEVSA